MHRLLRCFTTAAIVMVAFALSGCTSAKSIYLPDGTHGFSLVCGDGGWNGCYSKAGELCKSRGYSIVDRDESHSARSTSSQYGTFSGTNVMRTMVIACK